MGHGGFGPTITYGGKGFGLGCGGNGGRLPGFSGMRGCGMWLGPEGG